MQQHFGRFVSLCLMAVAAPWRKASQARRTIEMRILVDDFGGLEIWPIIPMGANDSGMRCLLLTKSQSHIILRFSPKDTRRTAISREKFPLLIMNELLPRIQRQETFDSNRIALQPMYRSRKYFNSSFCKCFSETFVHFVQKSFSGFKKSFPFSSCLHRAGWALLCSGFLISAMAEEGAVSRWLGGNGGLWSDEVNWGNGIPDAIQPAAEFLNFEQGEKVILEKNASASGIRFSMKRAISESDLTLESRNGATLTLECQGTEPGFITVISCASQGGSGCFQAIFDIETHVRKAFQGSKAIPAILPAKDFIVSFRKDLVLETLVNFGGFSESKTEILGNLVHSGLRFGTSGTVLIGGKGKTTSVRGGVGFAGGAIVLARSDAIAGSSYTMGEAVVKLAADGAFSDPANLTVTGTSTLETDGHGADFGTLTVTETGVLRIVLEKNAVVSFADSSSCQWTPSARVLVENHVPGKTAVSFGSGVTGLTAVQLAGITVNGKPARLDAKGVLQMK